MSEPQKTRIDLNFLDLPSVFQNLADNRRTGVLRVASGNRVRGVRFENGSIRMVIDPGERGAFLGDALVRTRHLTHEHLAELKGSVDPTRPFGRQLVAMGVVSEAQLSEAYTFLITERICDVFFWKDPECELHVGEPSAEWTGGDFDWKASVGAQRVVFEAVRRQDETTEIEERIPSWSDIPVPATDETFDNSMVTGLLELCGEFHDVEGILERAQMSRFEALKEISELIVVRKVRFLGVDELVDLAQNIGERCPDLPVEERALKLIRIYERAEELAYDGDDLDLRLATAYEAADKNEEASERYLRIGRALIGKGEGAEALDVLRQASRLTVLDLEGRKLHVEAHLIVGNHDQAATIAGTIIEDLHTDGRPDEAYAYARRMRETVPRSDVIIRLLAELELERGETIQAIVEFDELAAIYFDKQNYQRAAEIYHRILTLDEENIEAYFRMASALQRMGKLEEAVQRYKMLADMLSSSELRDTINWQFLIRIYEKIVEIEKDNIIAREWLADTYIKRNNLDRALHHLQAVVDVLRGRPQHDSLKTALRKILGLQALDFEARELLAEILKSRGEKAEAITEYVALAWVAMTEGDGEVAQTALASAARLDPLSPEVHQGLARYHDKLGNRLAAAQNYRDVGNLHKAAGRMTEAEIAYRQALKFDDRHYFWLLEMAEAATHAGAIDDALRFYQEFAVTAADRRDLGALRIACETARSIGGGNAAWADSMLAQASAWVGE